MKAIAVLALSAVVVGMILWGTADRDPDPQTHSKSEPPSEHNMDAKQELTIKRKIMQRDVELTDELCKQQCSRDLLMFLHGSMHLSGHTASEAAADFLKQHPHMKYLRWNMQGKSAIAGKLPNRPPADLQQYMETAEQKAKQGRTYYSPTVNINDQSYYVAAIPVKNGKNYVTAVIERSVQSKVETHQKKNLRLVPYPSDKRFNIQAADSDNLKKKDVDHPEQNEGVSHYHVNQLVVKFKNDPTPKQLRQIRNDIQAVKAKKLGYTYIFESNQMKMDELVQYFKKWNIEYAEPHYMYMTNDVSEASPNDVLYEEYQWNLPKIDTLKGWNISKGNEEVVVAVIDTGVDLDHPDLQGRLVEGLNIIDETKTADDDLGHGTHVAGVIAASVNNYEGVAGMSWYNKIMPIKVLDETGAGNTYNVAAGIIWAVDHGAKVINMSLGNYAEAQFLHDAIKYAYDRDVVLIAATGNDNTEQPGYPAAYPEVFAVSATDPTGNKAIFSNYGDYVDVVAPGENIASTYPDARYAALSGTSMASPHVAALAAMIRSTNPLLTNEEVMDIMRKTSVDIGTKGKDKFFGYGQIEVNEALEFAQGPSQSFFLYPQRFEREVKKLKSASGT
ncbi:S8 family peptidase [Marinicrinis lubricantis]|uniref:S8 family peptidase n=1 Tax=Marinicrinis lubricantis TaxID=2086470 RepID=A0ABW1IUL4_9BACL